MEGQICVIGVDVGGTNTDTVIVCRGRILASAKVTSTADITGGIIVSIQKAMQKCIKQGLKELRIQQINLGTTHLINAVVSRSPKLGKVAILRLDQKPEHTQSQLPFDQFPADLNEVINGGYAVVTGGFGDTGEILGHLDWNEVRAELDKFRDNGIKHVAVSGVKSVLRGHQEVLVNRFLLDNYKNDFSWTLSKELGQLSFLEREAATVLNEMLKPIARNSFQGLLDLLESKLGLRVPLYLVENSGMICQMDRAVAYPVQIFVSGPTNSLRGGGFLADVKEGIIADIGSTTTDIGFLHNGFPKDKDTKVQIGGVKTELRMPETLSIGLGGGSIIRIDEQQRIIVGPESLGIRMIKDSLYFGGDKLCGNDVGIVLNRISALKCTPELLEKISVETARKIEAQFRKMIADTIVSLSSFDANSLQNLVLVGGGAVLLDANLGIGGTKHAYSVKHAEVANAMGAALCQVGGIVDKVYNVIVYEENINEASKKRALNRIRLTAEQEAHNLAIQNGADPKTLELINSEAIEMPFVPWPVIRMRIKVVGDLLVDPESTQLIRLQ